MEKTINMQDLRYIKLFGKITNIHTRYCIEYNNVIIFCVPRYLIPRALGEDAKNIRRLKEILKKKVRVISLPKGDADIGNFISAIIQPVDYQSLEILNNEVVVNAGRNKAALLGRNKRRLLEMQKIIKDFFGKDFRIA
jgi:transcription antitermination factor NusA-like protein